MRIDAFEIAERVAGIFRNSSILPIDTHAFQHNGISAVALDSNVAVVSLGNAAINYPKYLQFYPTVGKTDTPNNHLGFADKIIENEVIPYILSLGE